jgi:hypothetical protein
MLFVCPECGDLGCGAITVAISAHGDTITWSDFRYENNYDATITTRYADVGPFRFDAAAYRNALEAAR